MNSNGKPNAVDEKFQYNGFSVMAPHSVLKAWHAQSNKQRKMINTLRAHYRRLRYRSIVEGVRCTLEFSPQKGDSLLQIGQKLENPEVKNRVLKLVQYGRYRAWHLSPIKDLFTRAVLMAARDGDQGFFKSLGEILKKQWKPEFKLSKLNELLLFNWIGTGICFCWFSDKALLDFIKLTEKDGAPFTMDAIRRARDRLGLHKLRRPLVRSVTRAEEQIWLSEAKPLTATYSKIGGLTLADLLPDETKTRNLMRSAWARPSHGPRPSKLRQAVGGSPKPSWSDGDGYGFKPLQPKLPHPDGEADSDS